MKKIILILTIVLISKIAFSQSVTLTPTAQQIEGKTALNFKTNNTTRMTIDNGGNVGIGTNTPETSLHVFKGSAGAVTSTPNSVATFESNSNAFLNILTPSTYYGGVLFGSPVSNTRGYLIYENYSDRMRFGTLGFDKMIINNLGNVSIGEATPTAKLDVQGDFVLKKYTISSGTYSYLNRNGFSTFYFDLNGTYTLKSIGDAVDGLILYLVNSVNSTLILVNNSPSAYTGEAILTNNGADITITGSGGATLIYIAGAWRLISYTQ